MSHSRLIGALIFCGLIAGCGNNSDHVSIISAGYTSIANGGITVSDGTVTLHSNGAPDATINATGDLSIGGNALTTDAAQREQLQHYYSSVLAVRDHGIATGKAGAAVAGEALKSVASGLVNGNPDEIGKQVDAKAKVVTDAALKICQDIDEIKAAQDNLAGQLPSFKPYAGIVGNGDIRECRKSSKS
jgi:Protein of unknown function (DUF2884)